MLYFLPGPLKGALSFLFYIVNTLCLATPLIGLSLFKFILPIRSVVVFIDRILIGIASLWISINTLNTRLFNRIQWEVTGLDQLKQLGYTP